MPKLIFYDIDGTLISQETHRMPPGAPEAMRAAHARGCLNIINTGRTLCNLDDRLAEAPIDGWVLGCGTRVILGEETLEAFSWSAEESRRIREETLRSGLPAVYEGDEAIWLEERDPPGAGHRQIEGMRAYAMGRKIGRIIGRDPGPFQFVKLFVFDPDGARVRRLVERLEGRFSAIERRDTDSGWELVPAGYSKATGIDRVREKLGVALEDCYVIGDSRNDLSMLNHVPHSIAMGNAEDEVKRACSYVTASVEEDGIAKALAHFGLSGD